jgi:predicted O-methyltransferase YrrM
VHNPVLIPSLLSLNFDKLYCNYFKYKLEYARNLFQNNEENDPASIIVDLNSKILIMPSSRNESFYIPLYAIIRLLKPKTVVETGIHRGVSSLFILQALEDNEDGNLHSIDLPHAEYKINEKKVKKSTLSVTKIGICVTAKLQKRWTKILGDSKIELPDLLQKLKTINLFLHDSNHSYEHMMFEFRTVWPHLSTGGILFADDINWNNALSDFSKEVDRTPIILSRDASSDGKFGFIIK